METTEWMDCGGNLLVRQGPHGFWWELLETDAAGFERFSDKSERAAFEAWLSENGAPARFLDEEPTRREGLFRLIERLQERIEQLEEGHDEDDDDA